MSQRKGHKKREAICIAPLQPRTLASVKTWGIRRELVVQDFPIGFSFFTKPSAKVQLFFDIRKFFAKNRAFFFILLENFVQNRIISCLPFAPNEGQREAIESLSSFLTSREPHRAFVLRGYAGTGKTSLVSAIVRALGGMQIPCVLLAPTGRAAKVMTQYSGFPAYTIHHAIYRKGEKEQFTLAPNMLQGALFIVDEASMISSLRDESPFGSGCLLDDLVRYVYSGKRCSMLVVGDDAQLPPVGQSESNALNPDFMAGYELNIRHYTLTEVARQAEDSGILSNATAIRKILASPTLTPPDLASKGGDSLLTFGKDVIRLSGAEVQEQIERSYQEVGIDQTLILTRSNKRTNLYNQGIRASLLDRDSLIASGDRLMITRNNYYWSELAKEDDDDTRFLANGDMVEVRRLRNERELYGFHFVDADLACLDYDYDISVTLWLDTLTTDSPEASYALQRTLFDRIAEDYPEIKSRKELIKTILATPYYNALQVRYAYAVTGHKAQGGQWRHVYIDPTQWKMKNGEFVLDELTDSIDGLRWLYTAITRATERIYWLSAAKNK